MGTITEVKRISTQGANRLYSQLTGIVCASSPHVLECFASPPQAISCALLLSFSEFLGNVFMATTQAGRG
jgi:hypothetical protein